jgi:hypothetical protein
LKKSGFVKGVLLLCHHLVVYFWWIEISLSTYLHIYYTYSTWGSQG